VATITRPPEIPVLPPMPDMSRAACAASPQPDLWTSPARGDRQAAITICRSCPVLEACAGWCLSLPNSDSAVWGALTAPERIARKRQEKRLAAAPAGMARRNASKAKCDHGHLLSGANLVMIRDPRDGREYRHCRECRKARKRASARLRSLRRRAQATAAA
jgi:hypothetical protein